MPGLCPRCGKEYCSHAAAERGQTEEEYWEDLIRELTVEEKKALDSGKAIEKIGAAARIFLLRKRRQFNPQFPEKK